jgi:hypothetical protein
LWSRRAHHFRYADIAVLNRFLDVCVGDDALVEIRKEKLTFAGSFGFSVSPGPQLQWTGAALSE